MQDALLHLGIGGIFCVLVLKEVFGFLKTRRDNEAFREVRDMSVTDSTGATGAHIQMTEIQKMRLLDSRKIADIHERLPAIDKCIDMHNVFDEEGVPRWHYRKRWFTDLKTAIEQLTTTIQKMDASIEKQHVVLDKIAGGPERQQ